MKIKQGNWFLLNITKGAGILSSLVFADGLVELPEDVTKIRKVI